MDYAETVERSLALKFALVDNILELDRGRRIVAVKAVSLAEEYLADHFPTFPVLPGVLMLQALVESATWLVRDATDFAPTLILLRNARNVTYKSFVKPGNLLRVEVNCRKLDPEGSDFDGTGWCNQTEVVKGRFSLRHSPCGETARGEVWPDQRMVQDARARFSLIRR